MKLNQLRDKPGATHKKKRVGRGPGSGIGKTGGRGLKGQKSRSGVSLNGYEGGQMPLYMRLPKRGFNVPNPKHYSLLNLGVLQDFIDRKKIDANLEISEDLLVSSGVVKKKNYGIRILAKGKLSSKVVLKVSGASKAAVLAIEAVGGSISF
jgi:large subunit ribosomal protein L15